MIYKKLILSLSFERLSRAAVRSGTGRMIITHGVALVDVAHATQLLSGLREAQRARR